MKKWLASGLIFLLTSCSQFLPPAPADEEVLDGMVDGLTGPQKASFLEGDELFGKVFGTEDGLGPIFVQTACASCHAGDGKAHPANLLYRTQHPDYGPQLQHVAIPGYTPEPIYGFAVSKRVAPAVTGLGFLAAVPDSVILERADPNDADSDGVSGVPHWLVPADFFEPSEGQGDSLFGTEKRYIGRFGFKAINASLREQTAGALNQDMGITSDFKMEDPYNYDVGQHSGDRVSDPEISAQEVNNIVFYLRTLKVPPRRGETDAGVLTGESLFTVIGCAQCHIPVLKTGRSEIAALSEKVFHPYTDLLLHDMGSELDDAVAEINAKSSEWRTTPLWGIGLAATAQGGKDYFLHDGSATTLEQAINKHGGEGSRARQNFQNLSANDKDKIIRFLESL